MNPKLIVIAGPLQGSIFEITEGEVSIGREASNLVRLIDPSISRRHSLIRNEGGSFKIVDLDSFNGTFVNGVPILEHRLAHADHIAVGDALLLFLLHDAEDETLQVPVQLEDGNPITRSTLRLRKQDAFYLQPEKVFAALPPTARIARDLNALLNISTAINSIRDRKALLYRLLELILEVIPADRGAILLMNGDSTDLVPAASWSRTSRENEKIHVSRTIALQALREGVAIISNNVSADPSLDPSESLITWGVGALVCIPLIVLERALGIVYLDTTDTSTPFDERHLQLLTAIAGIASIVIGNAQYGERLESENRQLQNEIKIKHQMIGESLGMRQLYTFISRVAPTEVSVIIRGESGTGKELAARAIHVNSSRAQGPFVAINCATLTESLLESELFGHEKGAFTGAVAQKRGKLEIADGGTVFLDEVGELALNIQAKLLRVLQEREFERLGGTRSIRVNIRILAATNRDLDAEVRDGSFRQDLYYRLNVISYVMPPLRERREDILLLANYFAAESSKRSKRRTKRLSPGARTYLVNYDWPGNVRELENAIERAVVLGATELIEPEDLPESILETAACAGEPVTKFYEVIRETKKQLILNAVKQANGSYTEAAKLLGVHPNNLHRLMRNMNLKAGVTTET